MTAGASVCARMLFALGAVGFCFGCGKTSDTVFYPLSVSFAEPRSEALEGTEAVAIVVRLNAPSESPVEVRYQVTDVTASGHDACGTRDYSLASGTLRFEPGQTSSSLNLRHLDDDLHEVDEVLNIELEAADGALLGEITRHQHTIVDEDRDLLVDVKLDFGAKGDAETDDTRSVQEAIDRASLSSAAVVLFPPGTYVVSSLDLPPGINYFGYGATLIQAAGQAEDAQMVRMTYTGDDDSPLTLVQGITFDGNRDAQGVFTDWEYQESELLYVQGDPERAGRLRLIAEDLMFDNTGGSGIILDTNTDAALCQIEGREVFTDLLKLAGGNSRLEAREIVGSGEVGTTGLAITGQFAGFGESHGVDVTLESLDLQTGDLEIDVEDASLITARDVVMAESPLYLRAVRSTVRIADSTLVIGPPKFRYNRILAPGDVRFDDCTFVLTESVERSIEDPETDRELMVAQVSWDDVDHALTEEQQDVFVEALTGQTLRFESCSFQLADDVEDSDTVYVAGSIGTQDSSNRILLNGASIGEGFDGVFAPGCSVCTQSP